MNNKTPLVSIVETFENSELLNVISIFLFSSPMVRPWMRRSDFSSSFFNLSGAATSHKGSFTSENPPFKTFNFPTANIIKWEAHRRC